MTHLASHNGRRLGVLAAGLLVLTLLLSPAPAAATAPNFCKGHLSSGPAKGTAANLQDGESAVSFSFGCAFPITGFSIRLNNEISGFDVALPVFDLSKALIPTESFACEGDTPGFGIGCNGTYSGQFHLVQGTILTTNPPCTEPRAAADLVVASATITKKGAIEQAITAPIQLGRVQHCPLGSGKQLKKLGKKQHKTTGHKRMKVV